MNNEPTAATTQDFTELRQEMRDGFRKIHARQDDANGRTGKLEDKVDGLQMKIYGDPLRAEVGLIASHREVRAIVMDARAVVRVGKWAIPLTPVLAGLGAWLAG